MFVLENVMMDCYANLALIEVYVCLYEQMTNYLFRYIGLDYAQCDHSIKLCWHLWWIDQILNMETKSHSNYYDDMLDGMSIS